MSLLKHTAGALALLTALALGDRIANADVFFNNFGANDTYQADSGFGFGGSSLNFQQAMAFTAGNSYLLTAGDFAVTLSSGLNPSVFQIVVRADAAGLPGPVLEQLTVTEDLGPFGLLNPPVIVSFAGTTLLSAGQQYWISMSAGAFTNAVWNNNSIGDVGPRAFALNGGPWNLFSATDARGAFRLHGTLVPAPGALALLTLCACAPAPRRRRR